MTYYAAFAKTARTYTVTFFDEDGQAQLGEAQAVEYGGTPSYTGETPEKAADETYTYAFAGWTPAIAAVTGEAVYTATYTQTLRSYTVKFVNEDGESVIDTQTVAYGGTPTTVTAPEKAGDAQYSYTFAGWLDEAGNAANPAKHC